MVPNSLSFAILKVQGERMEDRIDLEDAPDYHLFFSCFIGDVRLRLDGLNFDTHFGWVAALAFAIGFAENITGLPQARRSSLEFQEDDEWISFLLDKETTYVGCSYAKGIAAVPYGEALQLARRSVTTLREDLTSRYPALARNRTLNDATRFIDE